MSATVFGCGWILMGFEIVGGRMLSPWFGSGVWVWGSVISTFLIALSAGYFLGGILLERFPSGTVLGILITAAGISFIPVVLFQKTVCMYITGLNIHEKWGALLTAFILFFIPSTLLGTVSPFSVRLTTDSVEKSGARAGTLYAVSTIGSFFGTLCTSFFFILWMSIPVILYLSAGLLVIVGAGQASSWRFLQDKQKTLTAGSAGIVLSFLLLNFTGCEKDNPVEDQETPAYGNFNDTVDIPDQEAEHENDHQEGSADYDLEENLLFETESMYNYIRVTEEKPMRYLNFRRIDTDYEESSINTKDRLEFTMYHYKLMFCGFAHVPKPDSILFLGLGGGSLPMLISHYFPETHQDAVELDPEVVFAARKYFGFREHEKLKVFIRDGRVQTRIFIREKKKYDMIMIDVFRGGYIPPHMTTREFMEDLVKLLKPEGCIVMNLRSGFESYHYQRRTIASVFRNQYTYGIDDNIIVVADMRKTPQSRETLYFEAEKIHNAVHVSFEFPEFLLQESGNAPYRTEGKILTDDYSPADILRGMKD